MTTRTAAYVFAGLLAGPSGLLLAGLTGLTGLLLVRLWRRP